MPEKDAIWHEIECAALPLICDDRSEVIGAVYNGAPEITPNSTGLPDKYEVEGNLSYQRNNNLHVLSAHNISLKYGI